jgi:Domain of unknown function (DUF4388)
MSLAGRLEDVELPEILHFLALNNRTGRVILTWRNANGLVVVRLGRIVYAASSSLRETFGSLLVCSGLVSAEALAEALERQHRSADGRKLGAMLVEAGVISEAQRQDVLRQQIGLVVHELCKWRSGYFRFEVTPVAGSGEIGVDAEELVLSQGLATDQILLEALTRMGEEEAAEANTPSGALALAAAPLAPVLRGEVSAELLRRARAVAPRGLLLVMRGDEAEEAGRIGKEDTPRTEGASRRLRLALAEPSVVSAAVERKEVWRGAVPETAANERLLARLGGPRPKEALVVPLLLSGAVGLVFYGDDAGEDRPFGATEDLEWGLLEAALAMERDLLEARLSDFEKARGHRP